MKSQETPPSLHFFCGKVAAGKSTLALELAESESAVLISEDLWLTRLFPEEINTFEQYLTLSARLKRILKSHVTELLKTGTSVVMDFPGNTRSQRAWFKSLARDAEVDHCLHYVEKTNAECLVQLKKRNKERPEGSKFTSPEEFMMVTGYFEPPKGEEGFTLRHH
ncbi:cell division protein ZipA [Alphaproteobacteria bacterium 46_93_T64]|nr:cell division protein ZipA [Alphaproteobacteria bacterium 46_93_T64]